MTKTYHYYVRPFVPSLLSGAGLLDMHTAVEDFVSPANLLRKYSVDEYGELNEFGQLASTVAYHAVSDELNKLRPLADTSVTGRNGFSIMDREVPESAYFVRVAERDPTPNYWVDLYEQFGLSPSLMLQVVKVEVLQFHPFEGPAVDPKTHEVIDRPEDVYGEEVTIEHYNVDGLYSSVTISHPNHSHYPLYVADKLLLACAQLHDLSLNQLAA